MTDMNDRMNVCMYIYIYENVKRDRREKTKGGRVKSRIDTSTLMIM